MVAAKCFTRMYLGNGEQWMQPMGPFEALCEEHQAVLPRPTRYEFWRIYSIEQAERIIRGEEDVPIEPLQNWA